MSDDLKKGADAAPVDAGASDTNTNGHSVEYYQRELKRSIEERQSLKSRLDNMDAKQKEAEAERLKETQKWEEAYNKEVPTLKTELEQFKGKWTAYEEKVSARVAEKEGKLSKEAKDEYDKYISKLTLEDRDEWLGGRVQDIPQSSPASARTGAPNGTQKKVETMNAKERFDAFRANPQAFAKSII